MTSSALHDNIHEATAVCRSLAELAEPLGQTVDAVCQCLRDGNKLLLCGNGGSAADAAHFAGEMVCRFQRERRAYPAIALTDTAATLTAIANDYHYDRVFARQVEAFAKPGDLLIVFTTSGQSANILAALRTARDLDIQSIAFLGSDGGKARDLATIPLVVASTNITARIQEAHMLLYHTLCQRIDEVLGCEASQ